MRNYDINANQKNVVYTSNKLVNSMLDLVADEIDRIDSRILEPACGDGNFLDEVISRKLISVEKKYRHSKMDFEYNILRAVMSTYGVEIDSEARSLCINRLFNVVRKLYLRSYSEDSFVHLQDLVWYVLDTNIILGDALSLRNPDTNEPIVFAEWSPLGGFKVKRRDFIYESLIGNVEAAEIVVSDNQTQSFIPRPIKEYPIVKISKILSYGKL